MSVLTSGRPPRAATPPDPRQDRPGRPGSPTADRPGASRGRPARPAPKGERFAKLIGDPKRGAGPVGADLLGQGRGDAGWHRRGRAGIPLGHAPDEPPPAGPRARPAERHAAALEGTGAAVDEPLATFAPPPPVLSPVVASEAGAPPTVGSGWHHAQEAALAERLVTSLRVGRVGRDRHQVRLRLAASPGAELEVRLEHEHGRLRAALVGEGTDRSDAERLAARLVQELATQGLELDACDIELG